MAKRGTNSCKKAGGIVPFAIANDGAKIHYEVTGLTKRAPVLLVQGLGAEKNSWNLQRAALALRHRTIAFDNRGAGRSDKPDGTYNLEQMAEDAIAVLDAAGIESAHVVGLSMGGAISQIIALKHPNRVRSLTLVATACRNHEWREELLEGWAATAVTDGMGAVGKEAARWMIGPRSFRRLLPALGWMGPLQLFNPAGAFVSQIKAILATEGDANLRTSCIRTIGFLCGAQISGPKRDWQKRDWQKRD